MSDGGAQAQHDLRGALEDQPAIAVPAIHGGHPLAEVIERYHLLDLNVQTDAEHTCGLGSQEEGDVGRISEKARLELGALGEEEVRERLVAQPEDVGEAGLVREWLDQKARVAAELASTRETSDRSAVSSSVPEVMAARSGLDPRTVGIMGIFLLGILYTLYFARAFLLPITIAILLNFLLSPAVRALKRLRLPEPVGAALVVLGLLGFSGVGGYEIAGPAQEWLAKGPARGLSIAVQAYPLGRY